MNNTYQQRTFFDKTKSLNDGLTQLIFAILKIIGLIGAVILLGGVGWVAYICYTNPNESIVVGLLLVLSLSVAWQVRKSRAGEANNDLPSPTPPTHPVFSNDEESRENTSSSSSQTTKTVFKTSPAEMCARVKNWLEDSRNQKTKLNLRDKVSIDSIRSIWRQNDGKYSVTREELVEAVLNSPDFIVENDIATIKKLVLFDRKKLRDIQLLIERMYLSNKKIYNRDDSIMIDGILSAGHLDRRAEMQLEYLYKRYDQLLEQERQQAASTPTGGVR